MVIVLNQRKVVEVPLIYDEKYIFSICDRVLSLNMSIENITPYSQRSIDNTKELTTNQDHSCEKKHFADKKLSIISNNESVFFANDSNENPFERKSFSESNYAPQCNFNYHAP